MKSRLKPIPLSQSNQKSRHKKKKQRLILIFPPTPKINYDYTVKQKGKKNNTTLRLCTYICKYNSFPFVLETNKQTNNILFWQDVLCYNKKDISLTKMWTQTASMLENILLPGYLSWRLPWDTNNTNKTKILLLWLKTAGSQICSVLLIIGFVSRQFLVFSYSTSWSHSLCLWLRPGVVYVVNTLLNL